MTAQRFRFISTIFISTLSVNALALPIDWSGTFGVDSHTISNSCRAEDSSNTPGSQGIDGKCNASFQTYIFKLNPQIIVNDGVTLKGEFSTGHMRGGFAGDNAASNENGPSNNAHFSSTPAQNSTLNVNQMYMELYADTALVKIGRMSKHFGLGIVWDNGEDAWDRFFTMYDGIEAEMKIGNFSFTPYFAKISSTKNDNPTNGPAGGAGSPNGEGDVKEMGLVAKYENKNRDLTVAVLYGKRKSEPYNTLYTRNSDPTTTDLDYQRTNVTIIEPYVSKRWNKFTVAAEASIQTGDYGKVYDANTESKLSANAYVLEASYELNPKWNVGLTLGQVSGDKSGTNKFEATYLNPNYNIADLMFRYNYAAFTTANRGGAFDASVANAQFIRLSGDYKTDKWTWKMAAIMAKAMETAKNGDKSYHHEGNYSFTAAGDQDDDLGVEVDVGFDYRWNPNVTISGYYGYWKVGDYYGFSNTGDDLSVKSIHGGGLRATLDF